MSGAGDVNGDGFDDVIIGAPYASTGKGNRNPGRGYVVFGAVDGFPERLDLGSLDGRNGFAINGISDPNPVIPSITEESNTGRSVSGAGDINSDGFDDIIFGAPHKTTANGNFSGQSYVVFGAADSFPAAIELANLNGFNGFALSGVMKQGFSGGSVSAAGDVNGDGHEDIVIGDRRVEVDGGRLTGQSYVVLGGPMVGSPITGTDGDDTLKGTDLGESIKGLGGKDLIRGKGGPDTIFGNQGNDRLYGGKGADVIDGGRGADFMQGGRGNDTYIVDNPDDVIVESVDKDIDTVRSSVSYRLPDAIRDLVLTGGGALNGTGNAKYNNIIGNDAANRLRGGDNGDEIWGGRGNDRLYGGNGTDRLYGEDGRDRLYGGDGTDRLYGGDAEDRLFGGSDRDRLYGGKKDDKLFGGDGNDDDLDGGAENDEIDGGDGNDNLYGREGRDVLRGGDGDDYLEGGSQADALSGGRGSDLIYGDTGKDKLEGGRGEDSFWFNDIDQSRPGKKRDTIEDFELGVDIVGLINIDAREKRPGDQSFDFIGTAKFSGTSGELRFKDEILRADTDGDRQSDFEVKLVNVLQMTETDFLL